MNILFLTPYLPSPPRTGGARRLHGLITGLARTHDVSILSQVHSWMDHADALEATREYCREVVIVPNSAFSTHGSSKRRLQLRSLLSTKSFEYWAYSSKEYQAALDRLLARNTYDLIAVEFSTMAYNRLPPDVTLVLDEHNIEYEIHFRTWKSDKQFGRKVYSALNYLKLRREERLMWRRFDGCVLTSERDQQVLLHGYPRAQSRVIPNGVDTSYFHSSFAPPSNDNILFFGAIDYYPNTQGLLYFLREVWPRLLRANPTLKLTIVGQSPPPSILALQSDNVIVTGIVNDIRPYLADASVVIVPLHIGGGTRLKILEAMAMGKAIVSTSIGAEGIDVDDGRNIMIADTPRDFAARVEQVLADSSLRDCLGREARSLVMSKYEWDVNVRALEQFYAELQLVRTVRKAEVALA